MAKIVLFILVALGFVSCPIPGGKDLAQLGEGNDDTLAVTYTVTFDSQGGSTPNPASKTVTLGAPYGTLPTVTRSGYAFGGWWTGSGGTGSLIQPTTVVSTAADHVLYAKWAALQGAQWARTVSAGTNSSIFRSLAVDSSGNVYAAGDQWGTGTYTYGPGVSATGTAEWGNAVLIKYDSTGTALWARTVSTQSGSNSSEFYCVAVDSLGNVYAAGYQTGTGTFTYGSGVSATGTSTSKNVVLVKYHSSGTALWARTVISGPPSGESLFHSIAVDSLGNIYAAGIQSGKDPYEYGSNVTATGGYDFNNAVVVKYNSSGTA